MKISSSDPNNTPPLSSTTPAVSGNASSFAQRLVASGAPTDSVQLSQLSSYLASALSGSPAQVAKLSELGTAVSTGQYHVDADALSGSLIQHSIEFGGSGYSGLTT
jgi:flagellar biosynthesis anti-sigma factor FlgM